MSRQICLRILSMFMYDVKWCTAIKHVCGLPNVFFGDGM